MKKKESSKKAKAPGDQLPAKLMEKAKQLELDGEFGEAASFYEKVIKADPLDETAYNRLMVILRKQRDYKKELALINKGIKAFRDFYDPGSRKSANKKVIEISKVFLKSSGLTDKKGLPLYEVEPIGRWNRRKQVVEKKIKG